MPTTTQDRIICHRASINELRFIISQHVTTRDALNDFEERTLVQAKINRYNEDIKEIENKLAILLSRTGEVVDLTGDDATVIDLTT